MAMSLTTAPTVARIAGRAIALSASAAVFLAISPAKAQGADPKAQTQEFRLEEVSSLADLPVAQLKPKSVVLADRPPGNLLDPGTGFMRYEDWARARPLEQQFLSLYPGYGEPNTDIVIDGVKKHYKE